MNVGRLAIRASGPSSSRRTGAHAGYLYVWVMVRGWFLGVAIQ